MRASPARGCSDVARRRARARDHGPHCPPLQTHGPSAPARAEDRSSTWKGPGEPSLTGAPRGGWTVGGVTPQDGWAVTTPITPSGLRARSPSLPSGAQERGAPPPQTNRPLAPTMSPGGRCAPSPGSFCPLCTSAQVPGPCNGDPVGPECLPFPFGASSVVRGAPSPAAGRRLRPSGRLPVGVARPHSGQSRAVVDLNPGLARHT